jgi:hypothetical protein
MELTLKVTDVRGLEWVNFGAEGLTNLSDCLGITPAAASRLSAKNATRSRSMLMWWESAVNRSFFLCLATCRMRSNACGTRSRSCARRVLCWPAFPLVSVLRTTGSAADGSALFVGFNATTAESDVPRPCIIGYGSSPSRYGPPWCGHAGQTRDLPGSDAILLRVMWSLTPTGRQCLA